MSVKKKKIKKEDEITKNLLIIIPILMVISIVISGISLYKSGIRDSKKNDNNNLIIREGSSLYTHYSNYQESKIESLIKGYSVNDKFAMIIEDVYTTNGKIYISGVIKSGKVNTGDILEVSGMSIDSIDVKINKILVDGVSVSSAYIGNRVELIINDKVNVIKGQTIATKDSLITSNDITARIYLYKEDEGNNTTISKGLNSSINISLWDTVVSGKIISIDNMIRSGEYTNIDILLDKDITVDIGYSFKIIEDNTTIGVGVITKVNK